MTTTLTAAERITQDVTAWPGVTTAAGRYGAFAFMLGRRELGHLHGDRVLHAGFPKSVWQRLFDEGRIEHHPIFPDRPGWGQRRIASDDDVQDVLALLRLNYDRAVAVGARSSGARAGSAA